MKVAIIGGGAAGFFLSIHLKQSCPQADVTIFERANRVLAKVKISGGGRCNLTNSFAEVGDLKYIYPRGHRLMKRLLRTFSHEDAYEWFELHGVPLTTQEDCCVFPQAQDSEAVILCLRREASAAGVKVKTGHAVNAVRRTEEELLSVEFSDPKLGEDTFDVVAVTSGGAPHAEGHDWLADLGHKMEKSCPSLYTFNIDCPALKALMGIVVENATVSIPGSKLHADGPLLITHWGVSGPAVLKLSSYAARLLSEQAYCAPLLINWSGESNNEEAAAMLSNLATENPRKQLGSLRPYGLQGRLWTYLLQRAGLDADKPWGELGKKGLNRLANVLTADAYEINGKGSFREEFVTCGGVSLESINLNTLESKVCPGLYFAGEVLDIDAITGGFNFQAAWTTGFVAAQAIAQRER